MAQAKDMFTLSRRSALYEVTRAWGDEQTYPRLPLVEMSLESEVVDP